MAINPYDTQAIAGYNDSPPPDDGSTSAANLVTWQFHVDKLGDPVRSLAQSINAETLSAFGELVITTDAGEEQVIVAGRMMNYL